MAALANVVTQLGALMAAKPVATNILTIMLGWFAWNYLCDTYGKFPAATADSASATPLHSGHPNAASWVPLKANQQAHVVITEN